jgi:peptidoglycan-N-acetylglucosamine deacetylase
MKKYSVIITTISLSIVFFVSIFINEISHADDSFVNAYKVHFHKEVHHFDQVTNKKLLKEFNRKSTTPVEEEQIRPEEEKEPSESDKVPGATKEPTNSEVKKVDKQEVMYTTLPSEDKIVALTFDDGPDDKYTNDVLQILKEFDIKATFFVIGKNIKTYPRFMEQIINEGHAIGNHTWSHVNLTDLSASQIKKELDKTNQILKKEFGVETDLVRPPFGAMDERTLKVLTDLGFHTFKWSVDTRDWAGTDSSAIIQNVRDNVKPGGVVLQHSAGGKGGNLDNTLEALPVIISDLKEKGYQFVTLPEMLQIAQ